MSSFFTDLKEGLEELLAYKEGKKNAQTKAG